MLTEHEAFSRIRTKGFLGTSLMGGAAGCLAAYSSGGGWYLWPVATVLLALVGNALGTGVGLLVRRLLRRGGESGAATSSEAGLVLSGYGAFLGMVLALILGWAGQAQFWAVGGAVLGGALAAALGETMEVLIYLMALETMDDAGRDAARDKARRQVAQALPLPDEDDPPR